MDAAAVLKFPGLSPLYLMDFRIALALHKRRAAANRSIPR